MELSRFIIGMWNVLLTGPTVEYSEVISEEIHDLSEGFEGDY